MSTITAFISSLSTFQIVMLSVSACFTLVSLVFMVMFLVEASRGPIIVLTRNKEKETKSIFSSEKYLQQENEPTVNDMLEKLNKQADEESAKTTASKEVILTDKKEEKSTIESIIQNLNNKSKEQVAVVSVEEIEKVATEEQKSTKEEIVSETEEVVETSSKKQEEIVEDKAETKSEVIEEVKKEEVTVVVEDANKEEVVEEISSTTEIIENPQKVEVGAVSVEGDVITTANLLDYKARLEKVIENRDKLNKDLIKIEKSILNYERTKRRKIRNQKMLDRRASELTNLNLVMYSVTDIKNVDEEKKVKQEELTTHIAELKASIQDAEEFLVSNKEKNEHDVKMAKFLIQEKARFKEEIAELESLIAKTEGGNATEE